MISDSQAGANRYAQRLGKMRLLRINAGEHVDMEIIDLQRQKIVKTRMHSLPTIAHSLTPDRDYFSFLLRGGR